MLSSCASCMSNEYAAACKQEKHEARAKRTSLTPLKHEEKPEARSQSKRGGGQALKARRRK